MTLLSPRDIAQLTALDESAMPDTCSITTITLIDDGGGGTTEEETTIESKCSFVPRSGDEFGGVQQREIGSYALFLPLGTPIEGTSRVTFGGREFNVVWTPPPGNWSTSIEVGLTDT